MTHDLELEFYEVAPGAWRVCDARAGEHEPHRVVGFIERHGALLEALALVPAPIPCGAHPRWAAAVSALRATLADGTRRRAA